MTQYKIARVTNQQKKIISEIACMGLDRFYYNEYDEINNLAIHYGVTEVDIIACIQYVEIKVLGHYTDAKHLEVRRN